MKDSVLSKDEILRIGDKVVFWGRGISDTTISNKLTVLGPWHMLQIVR
jgi:hypothetical protein